MPGYQSYKQLLTFWMLIFALLPAPVYAGKDFSISWGSGSGHHSLGHNYRGHHSRGHHKNFGHYDPHKDYRFGHLGHRGNHRYYGHRNYPRIILYQNTQPRYRGSYRYHNNRLNYGNGHDYKTTDSGAWLLLSNGRISKALQLFARESESHPKRAAPKAGYALANAMSGKLDKGVGAMRRAFRIDADGMHHVDIDDRLRPRIKRLLHNYRYSTSGYSHNKDEAFMTAALHYLPVRQRFRRPGQGLATRSGQALRDPVGISLWSGTSQ